jgi:hypothetical protein
MKRTLIIAGIFFVVVGIIVMTLEMSDITMKIAGGCIAVAGVAFIMESFKKKK